MVGLLLVAACGSRAQPAESVVIKPAPPASALAPATASDAGAGGVITMARSACFGVCPDYSVTIHGDGLVEFEGRQFVRTMGKKTWNVPVAEAQALFARFASEHFTMLSVPQNCPVIVKEGPTVTTTLWHRGATHTVDDYLGNSCAPKVLRELEKAVDEAARVKPVIECQPDGFCRRQ